MLIGDRHFELAINTEQAINTFNRRSTLSTGDLHFQQATTTLNRRLQLWTGDHHFKQGIDTLNRWSPLWTGDHHFEQAIATLNRRCHFEQFLVTVQKDCRLILLNMASIVNMLVSLSLSYVAVYLRVYTAVLLSYKPVVQQNVCQRDVLINYFHLGLNYMLRFCH